MAWDVVRAEVIPAGPGPGADVVVDQGPIVAVIDGVTYKGDHEFVFAGEPVPGGRFAALVVADALGRVDPAVGAREVVSFCTRELDVALEGQAPGLVGHQRPSCVLAAFNRVRQEVLWVGDPHVRVEYQNRLFVPDTSLLVDSVSSAVRAEVLEAYDAAGVSYLPDQDPGREAIAELLRVQFWLANTTGPFGYGVVNGTVVPDVHIGVHEASSSDRIVLASDGYPTVSIGGVCDFDRLEAHLASALARDPMCRWELASTKGLRPGAVSFDDRSYLEVVNRAAVQR